MSNNENSDHHTGDGENRDNRSMERVLERLGQVEQELAKYSRPWLRTPSNIISIIAVVVSISIFSITYLSGKKETQFQKLQQISQIIDQISALTRKEAELYRTSQTHFERVGKSTAIANSRMALINQVDRLLSDVDKNSVSRSDLALLSSAYASVGRYKLAKKYLLNLAKEEGEPLAWRVMAWRSIVGLYGYLGFEHVEDAKKAAKQGLKLIGSEHNDIILKVESILIPYTLAFNLIMLRRYDEAFDQLLEAERNAWTMPCLPNRQGFLTMVNAEISKILLHYPDGREDLLRARANYNQQCWNDRVAIATLSAAQNNKTTSSPDYLGSYESDTGVAIVLSRADGVLEVKVGNNPARALISVSDDIFTFQNSLGYYLAFQRNNTETVTHVLFLQPNGVFSAYRK